MYRLLALLRLIHRELYLLGPGIVPAVLSKYRTQCAWLFSGLCLVTALSDFRRRRWFGGVLWGATAAVLFAGFESDARMWGTSTTVALGWGAIALAVAAAIEALVQEVRISLRGAGRDGHGYGGVRAGVGTGRAPTPSGARAEGPVAGSYGRRD